MILLPHRVRLIVASLLLTFLSFRAWLHLYPNTDLNVGPYNIHHLFTGILLIALCGIPLAIFQGRSRWLDFAALGFGVGLSMALDEWVFLIATDGSNASYLLRVSLWGGGAMVGLGCLYTLLFWLLNYRKAIRSGRSNIAADERALPDQQHGTEARKQAMKHRLN